MDNLLTDQALIGKSIELHEDGIRGVIKAVNSNHAFVMCRKDRKWEAILVPLDKIKHSRGPLFIPKERKGANHATGN